MKIFICFIFFLFTFPVTGKMGNTQNTGSEDPCNFRAILIYVGYLSEVDGEVFLDELRGNELIFKEIDDNVQTPEPGIACDVTYFKKKNINEEELEDSDQELLVLCSLKAFHPPSGKAAEYKKIREVFLNLYSGYEKEINETTVDRINHSILEKGKFSYDSFEDRGELICEEYIEPYSGCNEGYVVMEYYKNGFIVDEGDLDINHFYIKDFKPLKNGIKPGITKEDVINLVGNPIWEGDNLMVYAADDDVANMFDPQIRNYYPAIRLLFKEEELIAVWIYKYLVC